MEEQDENKDNWEKIIENEAKLRGYSKKTISSYLFHIKKFLQSKMSPKEFLLCLINNHKCDQTVRSAGFAIKFYLKVCQNKEGDAAINDDINISAFIKSIPNVKREKKLPTILAKEEIEQMILSTTNLIHRTMIQIAYAAGLRVSEIINLNWNDLDFKRNIIHLKSAKGKKDRIVMLSSKVKKSLHHLDLEKKGLVFKTTRRKKYHPRTVELIVKKAAKKSGIKKIVTPHSLRHSFATHLLENGTDIRYIKDLLGHANISTTLIYTKVSNKDILKIKSPID